MVRAFKTIRTPPPISFGPAGWPWINAVISFFTPRLPKYPLRGAPRAVLCPTLLVHSSTMPKQKTQLWSRKAKSGFRCYSPVLDPVKRMSSRFGWRKSILLGLFGLLLASAITSLFLLGDFGGAAAPADDTELVPPAELPSWRDHLRVGQEDGLDPEQAESPAENTDPVADVPPPYPIPPPRDAERSPAAEYPEFPSEEEFRRLQEEQLREWEGSRPTYPPER